MMSKKVIRFFGRTNGAHFVKCSRAHHIDPCIMKNRRCLDDSLTGQDDGEKEGTEGPGYLADGPRGWLPVVIDSCSM